ncbi:unnamed protein product, partial [Prorocentrum cordatum]
SVLMVGWPAQLLATKAADLAIVWGLGSRQCPPCPDCTVNCPTVTCSTPSINITCPTFSCPSFAPQSAEGAGWSGVFFFVAGLLVGFGVLTCTGLIGRSVGWLSSFCTRRPEVEVVADDSSTRDLALRYDLPGPPLWHERLILAVGAQPGHYAVLTPDGDIFVEELRPDNVDIAEFRAAPGLGVPPQDIPLASVHRFRAVPTAAEMIQHVRDGALQAGPAGAAAVAGSPLAWVAAEDTQDIAKGTQIPTLPDAAVTCGDRGIIPYGNGHLFVQRMAEADIYRFVHDDLRVLPVVVDASGERKVSFAEAVSAMDPTPPRGGLGGTNPALAQYVANQLKDQEIFQACAAVASYSSGSTRLALHKSSDPSMPIDTARRSRGIDLAIFFPCLQLMLGVMCLSKFWLLIEPSSAESG